MQGISSKEGDKEDNYRKDMEDWSSEGEYQVSEDNSNWKSDVEWNGDSSMAGEVSGVSETTEEEQSRKQSDRVQKDNRKTGQTLKKPFNMDDVGTDDDSRALDDTTDDTDRYFKSNVSEMTDMSDIEDQISEAQNKLVEDRQSLSNFIGLVDEVTQKGESLARKASETHLKGERGKFSSETLLTDRFGLLDDDEMFSAQSYDEVLRQYGSQKSNKIDPEEVKDGRIEYMSYHGEVENDDNDAKTEMTAERFEPVDHDGDNKGKLDDSIPKMKDHDIVEKEVHFGVGDEKDDKSSREGGNSDNKLGLYWSEKFENDVDQSDDNDTVLSMENRLTKSDEGCSIASHKNKSCSSEELKSEETGTKQEYSSADSGTFMRDYDDGEFKEPECSKSGCYQHTCCFLNIGGGGDGSGRQAEIINRLKKLRDDIANMREELTHAREECKKESEEVAKLIEDATARNKAAEQQHEDTSIATSTSTPSFTSFIMEDVKPHQTVYQLPMTASRVQVVPVTTALLEDRLRATRQTATSTYRASLDQLERLVEKEMASIQDSMTRLEPLNKMAAEWDHLQQIRSMTYMSDYRMAMVTSEMRIQPENSNVAVVGETN